MTALPLDIGPIHFVGIGGIGMSGIAQVMSNLGYEVQGSDLSENAQVLKLRNMGVAIHIGHDAANIGGAQVVVVSTAVKADNPELRAARDRKTPVVRRAEMLAELMRLKNAVAIGGTHGKTTTTSMVAALLDGAAMDPTVINGGVIQAYGSNARVGAGDWMVVEADESDGSFLKLPATAAVVTNIDPEHMDHYHDFNAVRAAFRSFVENIPFYGFAVICLDHPEAQALAATVIDRRVVSYGFNPQADARIVGLTAADGGARFDVVFADRGGGDDEVWAGMRLPMPGRHNVQNAVAALAVARELGVDAETARAALAGFGGVRRRFTEVGRVAGARVIDDYGHHPVEIRAVLQAAREAAEGGGGRVIAVAQPHRYTRLRDLFGDFCSCFDAADRVLIAPVYPAGEAAIEGVDSGALVDGLRAHGHRAATVAAGRADVVAQLRGALAKGDVVVFLGAGDITHWAAGFAQDVVTADAAAAADAAATAGAATAGAATATEPPESGR